MDIPDDYEDENLYEVSTDWGCMGRGMSAVGPTPGLTGNRDPSCQATDVYSLSSAGPES